MTKGGPWGVRAGYHDDLGAWRDVPPETIDTLLAAMGAGDGPPPTPFSGPPGPDNPVLVVGAGDTADLPGRWHLRTEDGAELAVADTLPADLPLGYHRLRREDDGHPVRLIVAPPACHLPAGLRTWGWAVQLYAARSRASWGMGDLGDLARLGAWSARQGAGMAMINPLHAALPAGPQQPSPYSPSSRVYRSPLYLRIEDVPGAGGLGADLEALAAAGRALNADRLIDRDAVWRLKSAALETLWPRFRDAGGSVAFDRYCEAEGASLAAYATFCALAECHGVPWTAWPAGLRDPEGPEVLAFVSDRRDRVRYHQWLQWLVDEQLRRAGAEIGVVQDLAIGVDPGGADAWLWQDCFALDVRVGSPPDEFSSAGQDWGLPPLDPWRLRRAGYEPVITTLRSALRHGGGIRIDHVMGLFRLFWIPPGATPSQGTYVDYPWRDLLAILALESHRAGAWVVGEDLGTVEPMVREELFRRNVLSYRLVWFEDTPPSGYPSQAMAAVTTHDLPTVAGLWTGSDLEEQDRIGLGPNVEATLAIRRRVHELTGVEEDAAVDAVVRRTYEVLSDAPSVVVAASLDDALGVAERPNLPGTTDERPNWRLALPLPLEDVESDPGVAAVASAVAAGRSVPTA